MGGYVLRTYFHFSKVSVDSNRIFYIVRQKKSVCRENMLSPLYLHGSFDKLLLRNAETFIY